MPYNTLEKIEWNGVVLCIEYPKGSIRFANTDHARVLTASYGHFYATTSQDGEELDCYIGNNLDSPNIFRISQIKEDGSFDEFKFIIGCYTITEAQDLYLANMPSSFYGGIQTSSIDEIKKYSVMQLLLWDCFSQWLSDETKKKLVLNDATIGFNAIPIKLLIQSSTEKEKALESLQTINNLVEISLRAIQDRCDGGSSVDGKGYRPGDAILVSKLLNKPIIEWDNETEQKAINLLYRYRNQLKTFGIDYNAIINSIDTLTPINSEDVANQATNAKEDASNKESKEENLFSFTSTLQSKVIESDNNGLPLIVEFEGNAEGISRNFAINEKGEKIHREWPYYSFDKGVKNTNRLFIAKEIYPRVQYSHPDDDPEETGLEPVGELIYLETFPETKRIKGRVKLFHKSKNGLEIAERYKKANEGLDEFPDFSIRTRPTCDDNQRMVGKCIVNDDMPLLVDFLRPYEQPGMPGSKGTAIIEQVNESKQVTECNGSCDHKNPKCKKCKDKLIIKNTIKENIKVKQNRIFENFNNQFSLAGRVNNSRVINKLNNSKGVESMANIMPFLEKMAGIDNPEIRQAMVDAAKLLTGDEGSELDTPEVFGNKPLDDKNKPPMDNLNKPSVDKPKDDKAMDAPESKAYEKLSKELAEIKASLGINKTTSESSTKVDSKVIAESLGIPIEAVNQWKNQVVTTFESTNLETQIKNLKNKAVKENLLFCGHNIGKEEDYPTTALESAIKESLLEGSLEKSLSFLKGKLEVIAKETKHASEVQSLKPVNNGAIDANYQQGYAFNGQVTEMENLELKKGVEEVKKHLVAYLKDNDPEGYKRYERNSKSAVGQQKAEEMFQKCLKTYGAEKILGYNKKAKAREDVSPNGSTNLPNYPTVMTAMMMVTQWRRSPVWDLVGNNPDVSMKLGNVLSGSKGPMGQFVEIFSESRSQRKDHDAGYIQSASDPQKEISVYHAPRQYFAYQETTRIRWETQLEAFLGMAPLFRDIPARLLFNLMEELDFYTEQRISTEIMRASDAYQSTTITNETTTIGSTNCWSYTGGTSGITAPDGTVVTNGIGWVWLRRGAASGTTTPTYGPVVRSGLSEMLNRSTLTFPATYPVTINAINSVTQSRGMYDSVSQSGVKVNFSDPDPTFIVLWDIGVIVFLIGSGFDSTHMPTIAQYSRVDNVERFDFTAGSGETTAMIANRYLEAIAGIESTFAKRQVKEQAKRYVLASNLINQRIAAFATHLQGLNQLQYASIDPSYANEADYVVAKMRRTRLLSTTEPLYANDNRAIVGTEGLTIYDELMPPMISGIDPGMVIDSNGRGMYTSESSRAVARRALIATIPPYNPVTDEPTNFGYGSFYFTAIPQQSGLPI